MKTTLLAAVAAVMLTTSHAWVPRPTLPGDNFQLAEGNGQRTRVVEGNGPRTRVAEGNGTRARIT